MHRSTVTEGSLSLAVIDLDRFSNFNAQFGYAAGDRVLHRLESKLERLLRSSDDVARSGNDEFAIVLWNAPKNDAVGACRRIQSQILQLEGMEASIGCATLGEANETAEILIVEARMAMWRSRGRGGNRITHFDDLSGKG
jgi:diguanylate cyclase (GGDEF)-like protein